MMPAYYRHLNIPNDPFNKQSLMDRVRDNDMHKVRMWKHWSYKDPVFKPEFHAWLDSLGCYVANAEVFYIPAGEQLVWHLDMWPPQDHVKINFVWNAPNHTMQWGKCINPAKQIDIAWTPMNTHYVSFEPEEIELVEQTKVREENPILVNVGVPHKVINRSDVARWCLCIVPHYDKKRILFEDAVKIFSEYVVD
jgi:hypothetical protein